MPSIEWVEDDEAARPLAELYAQMRASPTPSTFTPRRSRLPAASRRCSRRRSRSTAAAERDGL